MVKWLALGLPIRGARAGILSLSVWPRSQSGLLGSTLPSPSAGHLCRAKRRKLNLALLALSWEHGPQTQIFLSSENVWNIVLRITNTF